MPHSTRRRQKHSKLLNRLYPSYCGSENGCSRTLGDVLRSWAIPEVEKSDRTQEGTRKKRRRVEEWRSLEAVLRDTLVLNWRRPDINPCCVPPPGSPSSEQNQTFAALLDGVIMALHHEPKRHGGVANVLCLGSEGQGGSELRHSRIWAELHRSIQPQVTGPSVPELASRKHKLTDHERKSEKKRKREQVDHYENVKLPWPSFVPASHILYSASLRNNTGGGGLHRSHVLNRIPPNEVGAVKLMKDIFIGPGKWQHYQASSSRTLHRKLTARLLCNGIPLFEDILKRHKRCKYGRLLSRYCPLPRGFRCPKRIKRMNDTDRNDWPISTPSIWATAADCHATQAEEQVDGKGEEKKKKKKSSDECEWVPGSLRPVATAHGHLEKDTTALSSTPPHHSISHSSMSAFVPVLACDDKAVASFLASICRALLPVKLFGDMQNLSIVINTVTNLARLKRGECLPLNSLPQGLRVNAVEWLLTKSESRLEDQNERGGHQSGGGGGGMNQKRKRTCISSMRARERALLCLLRWIVCRLCVSVLRTNFYATEGEGYGHQILYFRGPVWTYLRRQGLRRIIRPPSPWDDVEESHDMKQDDCTIYRRVDMTSSKTASSSSSFAVSPHWAHHHVENMGLPLTHLPPSVLRLLPKKCGGFRGLVTLSRGVNNDGKIGQRMKGGGANSKLRELFHILKYELSVQPHKIGFGVLGMDDIFARVKPYFCSWRENNNKNNNFPSLFLVSCDIAGCYDSIKLDRLIGIAEELMSQESYVVQRLSCCTPHEALYKCFTRWPCTATPADYRESLKHRASHVAKKSYGTIISENPSKSHLKNSSNLPIDRELASKLLRRHLLNHRVIVPGEQHTGSQGGELLMLQQIRGIPQGSVLSTLLCHMYYGQFENEILKRTLDNLDRETMAADADALPSSSSSHPSFSSDSLLIRLVDDFLLITPRRCVATSFLNAMSDLQKTSSPYGFTLKTEKTCVSFDMSEEEVKLAGGTARRFPKTVFPWCGLLLDGERGEVTLDTSRLLAIPLRYSFSVQHGGISPGVTLRRKMKSFLGARMHLLLIDTDLNSQKRVLANAYRLLLLCACKTLAYAHQQKWRGCSARIWDSRENTMISAIVELAFYAHSLMRSRAGGRLKGFSRLQQDIGTQQLLATNCCSVVARCNVKRSDVAWLALAAFHAVLSSPYQKKHHQWDRLRRKLKIVMGSGSMRMGGTQTTDSRVDLTDILNDPSARKLAEKFVLG